MIRITGIVLCLPLLCMLAEVQAQKPNSNTMPYPYGNPVITHMYTADASPHVMPDGRVWMVTSVDHENGGNYATMHKYHTFSSADMVHWVDHGEVLNVWDVIGEEEEPEGEDWALWAPDMVYHQGTYFLYFPVRIVHTDSTRPNGGRVVTSYIAVAESDAPDQPFTVVNPRIEGTRGIDPSVFIDDDGEKYLYYGNHYGARLADNMIELEGEPVHMEVNDHHFMEAIWMHKREGKYFLSYHRHYGKPIDRDNPNNPAREKSRLDFAVGDNPMGPFSYTGILNYELGVNVNEGPNLPGYDYVPWRLYQSNHGGIVEFHGKEYLFYHTSALSSWRQQAFQGPGTWTQRSVCVDEIDYDEAGMPMTVQQTLRGVELVDINQPAERSLGGEEEIVFSQEGDAHCIGSVDLGTGYYYAMTDLEAISGDSRLEIRLDRADGQLAGTMVFDEGTLALNDTFGYTMLREAKGERDVCLVFRPETSGAELSIRQPKLSAGAPKAYQP